MRFTVADGQTLDITLTTVWVAGWTGRDPVAVAQHIAELAELGVPAPSTVPLYYRVAADLLTHSQTIQVVGEQTSGEVEPVLIATDDTLWLGLASDHTDRALETYSVALAKQACAKPLAAQLWRFDEVADHLDQLQLQSWIRPSEDSDWTLYQSGSLAAIRPLAELMRGAPNATSEGQLPPGSALLCGTLAVVSGGVRPAAAFRMALHDPVCQRSLHHHYTIDSLPIVN